MIERGTEDMVSTRRRKPGSDAATGPDKPERIVRSVDFTPEQWEAISNAAYSDGDPVATFVRRAALKAAREMGFWRPFEPQGPKKE